ncbi:MAG: sulfatase-like hydrolase/transferase [Bacteroidaceae bacterium]|nr:sulfatase-like hydrolase/transferase [Bacteroidaceae bacterium]
MKNLNLGMLAFATLPGALVAQETTEAEAYLKSRPNVVMIYADDLGFGDLECYGAIGVKTPNVNKLSDNGLRFTNAHAVASTSTPSRYSLLTGEYPWRKQGTDVAAGDAAMIISPDQYTVADVFKEAGYTTAAFGKWHLGLGAETGKQDWNAPITPALADIGFDYSYIMAATADRVPCVFIENGAVANYDPSAPIYVSYNKNFEGEPTGADNPEQLFNLQSSHGHNNSIINGIGRIGYMKGGGKALWKDEDIADSITVHAVDFIKENSDKPFFMYFATNDVHVPRFPHPRFRGQSEMGLRGDAIVQFDWSVGEIINTLEEKGLLENTLIILTSDNGPVLDDGYVDQAEELVGDHSPTGGLRGGKYSAFEGGTRVPFIVHWPAMIKEQSVNNSLVSQIDFLDVMATIAGVGNGASLSTDGQPEEAGTWFGNKKQGRPFAIGMAQNHTLTLCTGDWKYIEPKGGAAMIPWGPKIETGYSTNPQLFKHVNGEFDETSNKANENTAIVNNLANELEKIRNRKYQDITIIAEPGEAIDLTQYFGEADGAVVSGDFISGNATDISRIVIREDAADGSHIGVVSMADGTIYIFTVIINPAYNGAYHIMYNDKPLFIAYNTTHDNSKNEGYKLISPDHYSTSANGNEIFIVKPSGTGYILSMQGKVLKEPNLNSWGHIMFSDNESEAGIYLFEETSTADTYKIRSSSDGINYMNIYKEHGVVGNDKAGKAGLATYTIEAVATFPLNLEADGTAAVCLPFNVVLPEGVYAYDITATDIELNNNGYVCTMKVVAAPGEILKRGTPTIIKGGEGTVRLAITMSDYEAKGSLTQSLLKGNMVESKISQNEGTRKYIFTTEGEKSMFKPLDGTKEIAANLCWLECSIEQAGNMTINFGSNTGIDKTGTTLQNNSRKIYNIAGERLESPQKGVNIIDNKKVLIK